MAVELLVFFFELGNTALFQLVQLVLSQPLPLALFRLFFVLFDFLLELLDVYPRIAFEDLLFVDPSVELTDLISVLLLGRVKILSLEIASLA